MARAVDHLVLAVPDLDAAAALYGRMGFEVGGANRHPWGTVNRIVRLAGSYLELISPGPGFEVPPPTDPAHPFAAPVARAAARGGGLAMVAFASRDADADAAGFAAAGLGTGRLDFSRDARGADGSARVLRFGLAFVQAPPLGSARLFTCHHHQPFGDGPAPRHANGALSLDGVSLEVDSVTRCASVFAAVLGAAPRGTADRPRFDAGTARIDLAPRRGGTAGRFASFAIRVEDLGRVRALLERAGVFHEAGNGRATVPAASSYGAALAFVPAACDAVT